MIVTSKLLERWLLKVSHDVKGPLGTARNYSELFLVNLKHNLYKEKTDKEIIEIAKECFKQVIPKIDEGIFLTQDLLLLTKSKAYAKLEDLDLLKIIKEVLRDLKAHSFSKNKELTTDIPKEFQKIYSDERQTRKIIKSIIQNAFEAVEEGGRVTIRLKKNLDKALLTVQDNGCGIPEEVKQKLFTPFLSTKDLDSNYGLGLFLSKEFLKNVGGDLSIESYPRNGTTVSVSFKLSEAA